MTSFLQHMLLDSGAKILSDRNHSSSAGAYLEGFNIRDSFLKLLLPLEAHFSSSSLCLQQSEQLQSDLWCLLNGEGKLQNSSDFCEELMSTEYEHK